MQRVVFFIALGLMTGGGCSYQDEWIANRPPVYKTSGVVLMDGVALEGATVVLHATQHDLSASGISDANGKFQLTTFSEKDGAVAGPHKVVVTKRAYSEVKTKFDSKNEESVAKVPKELLPKKYASSVTTDIEVDIQANHKNALSIELKSK